MQYRLKGNVVQTAKILRFSCQIDESAAGTMASNMGDRCTDYGNLLELHAGRNALQTNRLRLSRILKREVWSICTYSAPIIWTYYVAKPSARLNSSFPSCQLITDKLFHFARLRRL
jgi:hypothetical protein